MLSTELENEPSGDLGMESQHESLVWPPSESSPPSRNDVGVGKTSWMKAAMDKDRVNNGCSRI